MQTHTYQYVCSHIYTFVSIRIHIHIHMYWYMHTHICSCAYACRNVCACVYIFASFINGTYAHTYSHIQCVYTHICSVFGQCGRIVWGRLRQLCKPLGACVSSPLGFKYTPYIYGEPSGAMLGLVKGVKTLTFAQIPVWIHDLC